LPGQLRAAWLLRRHQDCHCREREGQEAQILQQPTPGRERVGGGLSDAQLMDTAAVRVAQKEDDEQGIDEQDNFDGVISFLPAITCLLFTGSWGRTIRRSVPSWAKKSDGMGNFFAEAGVVTQELRACPTCGSTSHALDCRGHTPYRARAEDSCVPRER